MNCVTIGEKHSFNDFGLILTSKVISPPKPKRNLISIPLRDGSIDLTEGVTDIIRYEDRRIEMRFKMLGAIETWPQRISEIYNYLHGQKLKIVFDDDRAFYYIGSLTVNDYSSENRTNSIVIEGICEPYKYDLYSSAEDWLWDTFDFEQGIINECNNLTVNGILAVSIIGRKKRSCPAITVSANMTVTYEGKTYSLLAGTQKVYDILLKEGENVLNFIGSGTITIDYTGGSL